MRDCADVPWLYSPPTALTPALSQEGEGAKTLKGRLSGANRRAMFSALDRPVADVLPILRTIEIDALQDLVSSLLRQLDRVT